MCWPNILGSLSEKLPRRGEMLVRLSPRRIIITPTIAVVAPRKRLEKWMIHPKRPSIPPRIAKPTIRPE
jgi:hypothetical protein